MYLIIGEKYRHIDHTSLIQEKLAWDRHPGQDDQLKARVRFLMSVKKIPKVLKRNWSLVINVVR